jgi:signal peptidase I
VKSKEKSPANQLIELVVIVAVALGLALGIQAFLVKPYRIPSESMEPTLDVGQRVLVNRIGTHFGDPSVGDIVVFHPPKGAESGGTGQCGAAHPEGQACPQPTPERADVNFIKRVVAVPGDKIRIINGHVIRNGQREKDGYTNPCDPGGECTFPKTVTVPKGMYFMMGDNRGASDDSRFWGPVPKKWIIGGAFATYWPPKRIGTL